MNRSKQKIKLLSSFVFRTIFKCGALFCWMFSSLSFATEYQVDSTHSTIGFEIGHMMISKVRGNFRDFEVKFDFDSKNPEKSTVSALIKTQSVNTESQKRDAHLTGDDFFAVKKHPTMMFVSTKITHSEGKHYKMTGDFTLLGVKKPVTFDVEFLGEMNDPWGGHRAGFLAKAKINRKDFGMVWNQEIDKKGLLVGEEVDITVNAETLEVAHKEDSSSLKK